MGQTIKVESDLGRRAIVTGRSLVSQLWRFVRHELLYLSWALMEVALLAPLVLALMPWSRFWSPAVFALWMLLVMLIPFNLNRFLAVRETPVARQQQIIILALVATVVISLRTLLFEISSLIDFTWLGDLFRDFTQAGSPFWGRNLTVFFLVAFLWWRGLALGKRSVDVQDVGRRLRLGGLIFAPIVIGVSMLPHAASSFPFILLFFAAGLFSLALTRAEQISLERAGRGYPMRPRWLAVVLSAALVTVAASGLLAMIVSGRGLDQAINVLTPFWEAIYFTATVVITTVTYFVLLVLQPVLWLLTFVLGLFGDVGLEIPELEETAPEGTASPPEDIFQIFMRNNANYLFWVNRIATVVIVIIVLLLLYFAVSRYLQQRQLATATEEGLLLQGDGERKASGLGQRLLRRLGFWRQWRAAASVRRLYRRMCAEAEARGYPRALTQTPYEYLPTLAELWPDGVEEAQLITEAYVRVRYGEIPESEEELDALKAAWSRLEATESANT